MYTAERLERIKNNPARLAKDVERLKERIRNLEEDLEYARQELAYILRHPDTEDQDNIPLWESCIKRKLRTLEDRREKLEQLAAVG